MNIITNLDLLKIPCKEVGEEVGHEIGKKLLEKLQTHKAGVGLAANQVGLDACVIAMAVKEPLYLINPVITEREEETYLRKESCLSLPEVKFITTSRSRGVVVEADNIPGALYFYAGKDNLSQLETACIQHEVDHINGITIYDRQAKGSASHMKVGRNEPCPCNSGRKHKKCCGV